MWIFQSFNERLLYITPPGDCRCVLYLFLKFWLKNLSKWLSSIWETVAANLVFKSFCCRSCYQHIVIWKCQNSFKVIASLFEKDLSPQCTNTPPLLAYSKNYIKTAREFRLFFRVTMVKFSLTFIYDFNRICLKWNIYFFLFLLGPIAVSLGKTTNKSGKPQTFQQIREHSSKFTNKLRNFKQCEGSLVIFSRLAPRHFSLDSNL